MSEIFRGFQRFSEVFQRPSQRPSQSAIFLSELRVVLPLIVLPLKTPTTKAGHIKAGRSDVNFGGIWPLGFGKRGLLEKGSFQKSLFSRDSREFRDARVSREPPDSGKRRRIRPFSRESRDFRESRDSASEKTPFAMTPFSGPEPPRGGPCMLPQMPILRFKTRVAGSWLGIARTEPRNTSDIRLASWGVKGGYSIISSAMHDESPT